MQPIDTTHRPDQHPAASTPRRLTLTKETLRRLTPAALRLAAGGIAPGSPSKNPTACRDYNDLNPSKNPTAC
jgi:hypothetical protein